MVQIPLASADYKRNVAKEARIILRNRNFEKNPVLSDDQTALLVRPGMKRFMDVGEGPIRAIYSQPGSFNDAVFVISYDTLWRLDKDGTLTSISSGFFGTGLNDHVSMAATAPIGTTPEYLFIADGQVLWIYLEDGFALGTLTAAGAIVTTDVIKVDTVYYQWTSGSVDTGTPAGTVGNPWLVALGISLSDALDNMRLAINESGTAGTTYSTALTVNINVECFATTANTLVVKAKVPGVGGNGYATTETGANIAWGAATLQDGGDTSITQVLTPDDVGMISVGYVGSYVICVPAQGEDINGRFYWIKPGETSIDPLDFATAERSPDAVNQVVVFGDQFWLPGQSTTEVWYVSGDITNPVQRLQGVAFDRGSWAGTALQVKDSMILVDSDGAVFQSGGGSKRISTPDIEERIRKTIAAQAAA